MLKVNRVLRDDLKRYEAAVRDAVGREMLPHRFDAAEAQTILARLKNSQADGVWLAASLLYRGDDKRRHAQR